MLAEALQQAGATQYERTDARKAHRNGYKDRSLKTRSSRVFPFEMQVFGRYARVEKAQVNAIVKSCHQGFSTRKIQEIVSPPGFDQVSSVLVSRIASDLDGQVQAFLLRPIEQAIPYLFVDASYYKVCDGARCVTRAVLVVSGRTNNCGLHKWGYRRRFNSRDMELHSARCNDI